MTDLKFRNFSALGASLYGPAGAFRVAQNPSDDKYIVRIDSPSKYGLVSVDRRTLREFAEALMEMTEE